MVVRTERLPDLRAVMQRMQEADATATYSVAWVDTTARGPRSDGRCCTLGEHAPLHELTTARQDRWALPRPPRLRVPSGVPVNLVSTARSRSSTSCGSARHRGCGSASCRRSRRSSIPLDAVADWNRVYGRRGSCSTSSSSPTGPRRAAARDRGAFADVGDPSFLSRAQAVRSGHAGAALVPAAGLDARGRPAARPGIAPLLDSLDRHRGRRRRTHLPGQGLPHDAADPREDVSRPWTTSAGCASAWTRTGCSGPTCPVGSGCDARRTCVLDCARPAAVGAAPRRHQRHRPGHGRRAGSTADRCGSSWRRAPGAPHRRRDGGCASAGAEVQSTTSTPSRPTPTPT